MPDNPSEDEAVVVVSAFSCAPRRGSEAEVGWQALEVLRGRGPVLAFVDEGYRALFNDEDIEGLANDGIKVCFRGLPEFFFGWADGSSIRRTIYYSLWQRCLPGWVREVVGKRRILFAHHVTWAKYSIPTLLHQLDVPLLVGPVGGGEKSPRQLARELSRTGRLGEAVRRGLMQLGHLNPQLRTSVQEAHLVWASTRETADELRELGRTGPTVVRTQVTAELPDARVDPGDCSRIVTSGRILGWKGFWLVVEAFARTCDQITELVVIGDGPELPALRERAAKVVKGDKQVVFKGWMEMVEARNELRQAMAFCFGSLHDSGGFVVLEALGLGQPVVCLKAGGPGELVTADCGAAIAPASLDETAAGMAAALDALATDRAHWQRCSEGALARAAEFTPARRAEEVRADYEALLAGRENPIHA